MKKKIIITEKGAAMKCNSWKEGQEIEIHENLATHFVLKGIAKWPGTEETKEKKESKKKKSSE